MQIRHVVAVCLCALALSCPLSFGSVPSSITVQGKLTDAAGDALAAGPKSFTFKIFSASVGGGQVWPDFGGEAQTITSGTDGTWVGLVGAVIPILNDALVDTSRWLEITVDGTTLPRVRLTTGPYAFRVGTVDGASGGTITSKVSIGPGHTNSGIDAFVAGSGNSVSGPAATVSGGTGNAVSGYAGTIGGGQSNRVAANYGTVGGGYSDTAGSVGATVAGGYFNAASGDHATIGGGQSNAATQLEATVGGGNGNRATGIASTIAGGRADTAAGSFSTVGGGIRNRANDYATVGGGMENRAIGDYATIGGGNRNRAEFASTIAGGQLNTASATNGASIVGGVENTADGSFSFIGGGYHNRTYGDLSTIGGGGGSSAIDSNVTRGSCATIPGGRRNRANGSFSFAAGRRAHALHHGTFVWADSTDADFASTAQDQFLIRATGGVGIGTNAPEGPWHVQKGSAGSVTANSNSIAVFETSSSNGWLSIIGNDNAERGLLFTEPSNAVAGAIVFDQGGGGNDLGFRTGGNVTNMTLDASGNLTVAGCVDGNNTACASDRRFKKNISTVSDALSLIGDLRGVRYEWRADEFPGRHFESGTQYGVIAQEVREVVPEVIRVREDGYLSVEYTSLIPILLEAIKAQQKRIEALEKKLEQQTP